MIALLSYFDYFNADFRSYLECISMANYLSLSCFQHCVSLNFHGHYYNYFHINLGFNSDSNYVQFRDKLFLLTMSTPEKRIFIKVNHFQSQSYS